MFLIFFFFFNFNAVLTLFFLFLLGVVNIDLKRNDYTPDKVIFPQDEPSDLTLQPGNSTKESESTNSVRLML